MRAIHGGKFFQRLVHGEQLVIIRQGRRNFESVQVNRLDARAAFRREPSPGMFNQNTPHRLGRRTEKVGAILKRRRVLTAQAEPGFVDQGGGLERMAGSFARHLLRSELAQFVIDQGQQLRHRLRFAPLRPFQNVRELAQAFSIRKRRRVTTANALLTSGWASNVQCPTFECGRDGALSPATVCSRLETPGLSGFLNLSHCPSFLLEKPAKPLRLLCHWKLEQHPGRALS